MAIYVYDPVSSILDYTGHKIKNPSSQISKCLHAIPSARRVILSGTPIQNSLDEMWALFDFACQGRLLGTKETFKIEFASRIVHATDRGATIEQRNLGSKAAQKLRDIIAPHFLRRDKASVMGKASTDTIAEDDKSPAMSLQRKNDFVVWTYLSKTQTTLYENFLESDKVKELLNSTKSPLAALTVLKKVCDHPSLLLNYHSYRKELGIDDMGQGEEDSDVVQEALIQSTQLAANQPALEISSVSQLVGSSGKLQFLQGLMDDLVVHGHRCLIFSQSRKMLDIIERVLAQYKLVRIDGTLTNPADRQKRVDAFNQDPSINAFLLTTQVGGVGLTLTGADRVVIFDPSWNPATDAQAVDRAYRIGQAKNVIIYRLITCGTIEEKIYRKQVFKDSLMRTATQGANPFRYFTKQEIKALFSLDNPRYSATQMQLAQMHGQEVW